MQKDIVLESEADAWFLRNKDMLMQKKHFPHLETIESLIKPGQKVLEVGSSFGYNLNYLKNKTACVGFGCEPSKLAVALGNQLYPEIQLKCATIDDADLFGEQFDHIIIGFCLYLVDTDLLPEIAYKIDKTLKKGGFLHIFDFDTKFPMVRDYSHDTRIKTRKMDYSNIFLSFPNYFLASKKSWSEEAQTFNIDPNERCSTVSLFKEL